MRTPASVLLVGILCLATSGFTSCGGGGITQPAIEEIEILPASVALTVSLATPTTCGAAIFVTPSTLPGLAATITYQGNPPVQWLVAGISINQNVATLQLVCDPQGLAPGTYQATVTVTSTGPNSVPGSATVALTVTP